MPIRYILSYDASLDWHYSHDTDFRRRLVELIIRADGYDLKSQVSSTIYFTVPDGNKHTIDAWRRRLRSAFEYGFHFTIAAVELYEHDDETFVRCKHHSSRTIETNFDALVLRVEKFVNGDAPH